MTKSKKISFDDEKFCEALHHCGCDKATKRLGHYPIGTQMQMKDLLEAFVELKHTDFAPQLGQIAGEWNEANRIIQSFLKASEPSLDHALPPQMGLEIGCAIQSWGHYNDLPTNMRVGVEKSKKSYTCLEESMATRLSHFFNEMKVRLGALSDSEKPSIITLINLYQPALEKLCYKASLNDIHILLTQLNADLSNLFKAHDEPSKAFKNLLVKTQQDTHEIQAFSEGKRGLNGKRTTKHPDKQNSGISRVVEHLQYKQNPIR